ncbi:hypothetical protein BVRB_1g003450 [Beta vulgaris subsp. vulgaris]|nr:hypothetical protein BVRB_1g003450 [Beta vulgaris subsp. vulgaris]
MVSDLASGQWCTVKGYECNASTYPCCPGTVCSGVISGLCCAPVWWGHDCSH